ncbi:MAG: peroxiredoxin [Alphaproteobacteria bacterium]|nr:peroxiredoxin [Alphaproteobacteria bacterium]
MTIKPGDRIPSLTVKMLGPNGLEDISIADRIAGKKVIIFGLPGAFTPPCSEKHLPGYIRNAEDIKKSGVAEILCITVNDPFVAKHWGEVLGAEGKVTIVPDGNAAYTKAIGMDFDGSGLGLGTRSRRYSMIVENGMVKELQIEDKPSDVEFSSAEACLRKLRA